jgi:UDP-arabinose 4-epimerase
VRDYIHVTDLAVAHIQALEYLRDKDESLTVNLGTGNGQTVREVIRAVEKVSGKVTPVKEGPRRAGDPPGLYAHADKAYRLLGWKPRYGDIETIVGTAWNWHEKQR